MSSFNDNAYSYTPGTNRLLKPVNLASNPDEYVFDNLASLANSATQMSAGKLQVVDGSVSFQAPGKFFYNTTGTRKAPSPPLTPPSVPQNIIPTSGTTIIMQFNISGVGGVPPPAFSFLFGTDPNNVVTPHAATRVSEELAIYVGTFNGLLPNTTYYFKSVAANSFGAEISEVSEGVSTTGGGGVAPSPAPPTVSLVSKTSTSITVSFDAAGITGTPAPSFFVSCLGVYTPAPLTTGTTHQATITGLSPSTSYDIYAVAANGVAPNAVSAEALAVSTDASAPLTNLLMMTFLVSDGTNWRLDTDGNGACGTLYLTGTNAGQIISGTGTGVPSEATSITNVQAWGTANYLMVSFGGAAQNLALALPTVAAAENFVNSFWNQFLGASSAPNPLAWNLNTGVVGYFAGLDLDLEGAIGGSVAAAIAGQWAANVTAYAGSLGYTPLLTYTPQTPNSWLDAPSSQGWTNGNINIPFTYSGSRLSSLAPGFTTSSALLAPPLLSVADYVFPQIYNQTAQYLTEAPAYSVYNPVFTTQMAQWAYLVMLAQRIGGGTTKLIWAFSSSTAGVTTPPWTPANQAQLNAAISLINPLVSAQLDADGLGTCLATEWSGGIGFWTSPTGNAAAQACYDPNSKITTANMAADATMLWMEAAFPSPAPGWESAPVPIVDKRSG